jgi:hypothetical protein
MKGRPGRTSVRQVPATLYHVQKVSFAFKRKYRLSADDGAGQPGTPIGYAEKRLKVADEFGLYRDGQRTEQLATVRESRQGWLASLTGYEAFGADGQLLGSFGVLPLKSVDRTTWQFDQPGLGHFTGTERSIAVARGRRLLTLGGEAGEIARALVKYHFDFARDGEPAFSIDKPKVLADWYKLTVHDAAISPPLLFALAVTMEARQHH